MRLQETGIQVLTKNRTKATHGKRTNIHVTGGTGGLEKEEVKHSILGETDTRLSETD